MENLTNLAGLRNTNRSIEDLQFDQTSRIRETTPIEIDYYTPSKTVGFFAMMKKGFLPAGPVLCPHSRPSSSHVKPFPPKSRFKWYIQNTPAEALPQIDPRNLGIHKRDGELQIEDSVFVFFAGSDGNLFELDDRFGQCSNVFVFAGGGFFRVCAPPLFAAAVADLEATIGRLILSSSSSSSKKDSSSTPLSNAPPSLSSSSSSSSASSS